MLSIFTISHRPVTLSDVSMTSEIHRVWSVSSIYDHNGFLDHGDTGQLESSETPTNSDPDTMIL